MILFLLASLFSSLCAEQYPARYEGVPSFQSHSKVDLATLPQFLPYNPIVVEAGAYWGTDTVRAAQLWPKGTIIAFEPNPSAFAQLKKATQQLNNTIIENLALNNYSGDGTLYVCHGSSGNEPIYEFASSLLPPSKAMEIHYQGPRCDVTCTVLDEWCRSHQVDHVDLLKLELEGLELPVLKSSPRILETVQVIFVQTSFFPFRIGGTHYANLKLFLNESGFVLLSHWYREGLSGHAVFLRKELWDAYFKLSLGIHLND
jgi:FkbM family methyltransferase